MKLSPSTIAANLSAAAAAEAEAAACTNSTISTGVGSGTMTNTATYSTSSVVNAPPAVINTQSVTMNNANVSTANVSKMSPKDSQVVAAILQEMGIDDYEPRVLPQVVEFAYRYASRVLEDAQLFSSYAKKKAIDSDDVSFAIHMNSERSFLGPPSRDTILEIAHSKNSQPLPAIKSHNGMRLPADRYSLVAPNMRLVSTTNKQSTTNAPNSKNSTKTGTSLLSSTSNKTSTAHKSTVHSFSNLTSDSGPKRKFDETS